MTRPELTTIAAVTSGESHAQVPDEIYADAGISNWGDSSDWQILSRLFSIFNHDRYNPLSYYHPCQEGGHQYWVRAEGVHTSMSVGDVVQINDTYYFCDNIGWTQLN